MTANEVIINASKVCFAFKSSERELEVLTDLSFEVREKEFLSIVGPSGCGKTTLLKLLGGLYSDHNRHISLSGDISISGLSPLEARKKLRVGFVFQNPVLLPWRRVIDNVTLPIEIINNQNERNYWQPSDILELVGLSDFKNALPRELSGGMQQRVSIARALIFKPSILLMDEPFGSLDERTREKMNQDLLKISASTGATILFVTHSLHEAAFLSTKILVLSKRPASINRIIDVNLAQRSIDFRESNEFLEIIKSLRENLKEQRSN